MNKNEKTQKEWAEYDRVREIEKELDKLREELFEMWKKLDNPGSEWSQGLFEIYRQLRNTSNACFDVRMGRFDELIKKS